MLDRNRSVLALATGFLSLSDLRTRLEGSRSSWMTAIGRFPALYYSLPNEFANEPAFAGAITNFPNMKMVHKVFERFPHLQDDEGVWSVILDSAGSAADAIRTHAFIRIRHNFALMKKACQIDNEVYELLSPELQRDVEIIKTLSDASKIPHAVQLDHPEIILQLAHKSSDVAPALFLDPGFAIKWLSSDFADDYGPGEGHEIWSNEDVALALAKECQRSDDFEHLVPSELRANKQFMTTVAKDSGAAFCVCKATDELLRDFDFAVIMYGGAKDECDVFSEFLFEDDDRDEERIAMAREVLAMARDKVGNHTGFTAGLLYGVTEFAGSDCPLSILHGDEPTNLALKKKIAEILGVPTGDELGKWRMIIENVGFLDCYCGECCSHIFL